jgi:hypothetical protein
LMRIRLSPRPPWRASSGSIKADFRPFPGIFALLKLLKIIWTRMLNHVKMALT